MSKKFLTLMTVVVTLIACQKSSSDTVTSNGLANTPETKSQYDNTAFGVYKGVIVGSTGIIKLVINNGDNLVKAYIYLDNVTRDTLTCTQLFTAGQAITNARFVGRISTMDFSVNANGSNASIVNISIVGHSGIAGQIVHETSTQQVYCYQGTYSGSEQGVFDCIKFGNSMIGLAKCICGTIYQANGQVSNNNFNIVFGSVNSGATFGGNFIGNSCTGNWQNTSVGYTGTFTGIRTL